MGPYVLLPFRMSASCSARAQAWNGFCSVRARAGHTDPRERAYGRRGRYGLKSAKRKLPARSLENPRLESSNTCGGTAFSAEAANASHLSHRVHGVFSQIRGATQVQLLLDPHLVRFNSLAAYS